jgi:hypothetical protein
VNIMNEAETTAKALDLLSGQMCCADTYRTDIHGIESQCLSRAAEIIRELLRCTRTDQAAEIERLRAAHGITPAPHYRRKRLMTDLIEQIKADRNAGTPGTFQVDSHFMQDDRPVRIAVPDRAGVPQATLAEVFHDWDGHRISWKMAEANARRFARVPEMEKALMDQAADEARRTCRDEKWDKATPWLREVALEARAALSEAPE